MTEATARQFRKHLFFAFEEYIFSVFSIKKLHRTGAHIPGRSLRLSNKYHFLREVRDFPEVL